MVRRFALLALGVSAAALVASGCGRPASAPGQSSTARVAPTRPSAGTKPESVPTARPSLTVFAGSASKPALDELAKRYSDTSGTRVEITYGGSGSVLTQFAQEQFGDIYIPGSDDFMDRAEKREATLPETRTVLVYLVPTICIPKGNPRGIHTLEDLSREGTRVVIGETKSVCLGAIAQEVLEKTDLWEKTKPRIASFATSCEDTLNTLLLGESDAIIGWDVFARQHPDKVESVPMPPQLARPCNIPAAVIRWSKQPEGAKQFIASLASEDSKETWATHGYTIQRPSEARPGT